MHSRYVDGATINSQRGYVGAAGVYSQEWAIDGNKSAISRYWVNDDQKSADPLVRQAGGVPLVSRPERMARMGSAARTAQCESVGGPHQRNGRVGPALLVSDVVRHAPSTTV